MHDPSRDIEELFRHELPRLVNDTDALRRFSEHHVFAVWDFMSLLKSLQADLCPARVPWTAPTDPEAARFINEIILDEESDEVEPGRYLSHYVWYREAMAETGADGTVIDSLIARLSDGATLGAAIRSTPGIPEAARRFLEVSVEVLEQPLVVRAAVFLRAREAIIPGLFQPLSRALVERGLPCRTLVAYLDRHVEVDGDDHGPRARALLTRLLDRSAPALKEAAEVWSRRALVARRDLWDALAVELRGRVATG